MNYRNIKKYTSLQHMNVGPFKVKQPLPNDELEQVSPFILLHHGGPQHHLPGEIKARLSPHPHRGFEPVTFLFSGKLHHKDSAGNEGFLQTGDVQWMTSGSGIIHSEGPSADFANEGGDMEIIQLWVNLPRENKMTSPKYQDIKKEVMPVSSENGFELKLVAGEYKGQKGPASTFTPILAMMVHFNKDGEINIPVPNSYNALFYVLEGSVESNGVLLDQFNLAVASKDGDEINLKGLADGKLLFLAGEPINEPLVSYGPFVMNYPGEIKQAIMDFELGKMGILES
jgi:quercetin 2,3-dioxygenase